MEEMKDMKELNEEILSQISGGSDDSGFDLLYSLFNLYDGKCFKDPFHNNMIYKFVGFGGVFDGIENVEFIFEESIITTTGERKVICSQHSLKYELFRELRPI